MLIGLLLFILFEAKRRQRIIPVIKPLANTTLEFVRTISNMYWQARDHKAIAEKKIVFFIDQVRQRYYLPHEINTVFIELLAKKSGQSLDETQKLFALIAMIQNSNSLAERTLWELNKELEKYK
jgi:cation transport regulator ChaC